VLRKDSSLRRIWLIAGGPSTEFEVSLNSGRVVCEKISLRDKVVRPVGITRLGRWVISERVLHEGEARDWVGSFFRCVASDDSSLSGASVVEAAARMIDEHVDCAFLVLHGQFGEDGRVQGFLDTLGIPYTGSGLFASALAFDKARTLQILREAGLRTPRGMCATAPTDASKIAATLRFPLFVKPVCGGSSVGMSLVSDPMALPSAIALALETDSHVLVEERVEGLEVSCGVIDRVRDNRIESLALPPTAIRPRQSSFFDYNAKYTPGGSEEITPAPLPAPMLEHIRDCAFRAHKALGCKGMSRSDFIIPEDGNGEPAILEVNTIPGMTSTSLLPQQAQAAGIDFSQLLDELIETALWCARQRRR
jgi:D-alanine-D-alanine ligase